MFGIIKDLKELQMTRYMECVNYRQKNYSPSCCDKKNRFLKMIYLGSYKIDPEFRPLLEKKEGLLRHRSFDPFTCEKR